ncbi:hypothetical protein SAMN04487833_13619 [Sarcina sp. DSM 11001]|nr:hypothetical protein SAMN04487833_13619 [Sarcina sp. DSM 11001]
MLWNIKTHFPNLICQILRQIYDRLCKKGKRYNNKDIWFKVYYVVVPHFLGNSSYRA